MPKCMPLGRVHGKLNYVASTRDTCTVQTNQVRGENNGTLFSTSEIL